MYSVRSCYECILLLYFRSFDRIQFITRNDTLVQQGRDGYRTQENWSSQELKPHFIDIPYILHPFLINTDCIWWLYNTVHTTLYKTHIGPFQKHLQALKKLRALKCSSLNYIPLFQCMGRYIVWNVKGYFWNSTQNILFTHWKCVFVIHHWNFKSSHLFSEMTPEPL